MGKDTSKIDDKVKNKLHDYIMNYKEYEWTLNKARLILANLQLDMPKKIYSIKARIKKPESLVNKIKKNRSTKDIVGLRVIYYFKEDVKDLHECILKNFDCEEIEVYFFKDDEELIKEIFNIKKLNKDGIKIKFDNETPYKRGYTGIHYTVYLKNLLSNRLKIPIEIQLKNVFEEVWGELEHDIGYKYPKVDAQEIFVDISKGLLSQYSIIRKLYKLINERMETLVSTVGNYYGENNPNVTKEKIEKTLMEHNLRLESVLDKINNIYGKVCDNERYKKMLLIDKNLETFEIFLRSMSINMDDDECIHLLKKSILKIFWKRVIESDNFFEECDEILSNLSTTDIELSLNILNSEINKWKIRRGIDKLNEFLKEVWTKYNDKLSIINLIFNVALNLTDDGINKWDTNIINYYQFVDEVTRDKIEKLVSNNKEIIKEKFNQVRNIILKQKN